MKKTILSKKKIVFCTLTLCFLFGLISIALAAHHPEPTLIVNTTLQPVPVTGSMSITGTADVNVTNTPTVNLAPGTQVTVVHSPDVVQTNIASMVYTVPDGKLLIIKYVSGSCSVGQGTTLLGLAILTDFTTVNEMFHDVIPIFVNTWNLSNYYSFSQQTNIYAQPNSKVGKAIIAGAGGNYSCSDFIISGELVPAP